MRTLGEWEAAEEEEEEEEEGADGPEGWAMTLEAHDQHKSKPCAEQLHIAPAP